MRFAFTVTRFALAAAAFAAGSAMATPASAPKAAELKCPKGQYVATVKAVTKVDAPGHKGVSFAGKGGHGDKLFSDAEFEAKKLSVGAKFCMEQESGD